MKNSYDNEVMAQFQELEKKHLDAESLVNIARLSLRKYRWNSNCQSVLHLKYLIDKTDNNFNILMDIVSNIVDWYTNTYLISQNFSYATQITLDKIKDKFRTHGFGMIGLAIENLSSTDSIIIPEEWKNNCEISILDLIVEIAYQRLKKILNEDDYIKLNTYHSYFYSVIEDNLAALSADLAKLNVFKFMVLISSIPDMAKNYSKYGQEDIDLQKCILDYFKLAINKIDETEWEDHEDVRIRQIVKDSMSDIFE